MKSWSFRWQNMGVSEATSKPADLRQMRAVNASMFFLPLGEDKGPRGDLKPICMVLKSHDVLQHMRSLWEFVNHQLVFVPLMLLIFPACLVDELVCQWKKNRVSCLPKIPKGGTCNPQAVLLCHLSSAAAAGAIGIDAVQATGRLLGVDSCRAPRHIGRLRRFVLGKTWRCFRLSVDNLSDGRQKVISWQAFGSGVGCCRGRTPRWMRCTVMLQVQWGQMGFCWADQKAKTCRCKILELEELDGCWTWSFFDLYGMA